MLFLTSCTSCTVHLVIISIIFHVLYIMYCTFGNNFNFISCTVHHIYTLFIFLPNIKRKRTFCLTAYAKFKCWEFCRKSKPNYANITKRIFCQWKILLHFCYKQKIVHVMFMLLKIIDYFVPGILCLLYVNFISFLGKLNSHYWIFKNLLDMGM